MNLNKKVWLLVLVIVLALAVSGLALANGGVTLQRWVLAGGATNAAGGDAALYATLGQPVVGDVSGGDVTVGQGYGHGGEVPPSGNGSAAYLPFVRK